MFDNLVQSAMFPAILEILRSIDASINGVKARLLEQEKGENPMTALVASQQLAAIAAWEPALKDIMTSLDTSHQSVHGAPLPHGR